MKQPKSIMDIEEAKQWARDNCAPETCDRLRSRRVVRAYDDHLRKLQKRFDKLQEDAVIVAQYAEAVRPASAGSPLAFALKRILKEAK